MSATFNQRHIEIFGDAVASYLEDHRGKLDCYSWDISDICVEKARALSLLSDEEIKGGFKETIQLREAVSQQVNALKEDDPDRRAKLIILADFVIRGWGALGGNKSDTIEKYVNRFTGNGVSVDEIHSYQDLLEAVKPMAKGQLFKFDGVASWSKWLSFVWSDWALIYDARIAFALNAIHFIQSVDAPVLPEPDGRNALLKQFNAQSTAALSRLALASNQSDDVKVEIETAADIKKMMSSAVVRKADTYIYYLEIMTHAHKQLWPNPEDVSLLHTEMLLFMLSVEDVVKDFAEKILVRFSV